MLNIKASYITFIQAVVATMIKLYEELVKLCMQNTIQGEGFELFIKPRLGGGGSFILSGSWLYERPQANSLGREPKRGKPIPYLAGGVFIIKYPINAHL